jgi:hypothetical protein
MYLIASSLFGMVAYETNGQRLDRHLAYRSAVRWTSFIADREDDPPRMLFEQGNPAHRLRVEHNKDTLLIHLSGEDGDGWTVLAVDRATRRWVVAQARRQLDAAEDACSRLYGES